MDVLSGATLPSGNLNLVGIPPGVIPALNPGLASNRLDGTSALGPVATAPTADQSGLLQSLQIQQSLLMQMMGLLLGLMANPGGGTGNFSSESPVSALNSTGSSVKGDSSASGSSAGGTSRTNAGAATAKAPPQDTGDQGEIKSYIAQAAAAYGTDPKVLTEIARRESNFQAGAVNNWDSNAKKGTPSKGMFQFIEPTFKSYAASAKKANPQAWEGLGELNWLDWRQQALAASWAIKNGHGSAWATYAAAGGK